jgi:hypothetical protein
MTLRSAIARLVMDQAVTAAPPSRAIWAEAMAAEFEALDRGHLRWAMGCRLAVARWNMGRDVLFLVAAIAFAAFFEVTVRPYLWGIIPHRILYANFYLLGLGLPALSAFGFAFLFPRHAGKAAVVMSGVPWIISAVIIYREWGANALDPQWKVLDAPQTVGYTAWFGACYVAADLGRRAGRLRNILRDPGKAATSV